MKDTLLDTAPRPNRVLSIDLDDPLPRLVADEKYGTATVVAWRRGKPRGIIDIDLHQPETTIHRRLRSFASHAATESVDNEQECPEHHLPMISVVVSTIVAREADLALLLEAFDRLDYPRVEFIFVDNRRKIPANDPLPALVAGRPQTRVVREERPGISAGRNAGIQAARGEIIAFTDDDVRVDVNWLRAIGSRFVAEPHLQAVTGLVLPAELETPAQIWYERYYGGFSGERTFAPLTLTPVVSRFRGLRGSRVSARDSSGTELRQFAVYGIGAYGAGANMAFRKNALLRHGGFDIALGTGTPAKGGEDLATLIDIVWGGGSIGYEPSAVVHHRHRREYPELLGQLQNNGLGFTAMLASLVSADRRHILSIGWQLPRAAWAWLRQGLVRITGRAVVSVESPDAGPLPSYPKSLVLHELRRYPAGPLAYWRSRRFARGWHAPTTTTA
ncbi:MAG TPA: glycosyltransferase [Glaciihabitans sp.]|jgi:cellulose synthase/poly-beta-1,6-N-acetylglucosamine synthase-like glycosyltransferase|nr:glycosyltransferase [Glaciihabitans sp.]